jgi:hypothetical protein
MMHESVPVPLPTAVNNFTWAASAGWATFVLILGSIGLLIHRAGPFTTKLAELIINRGDKIRAEERSDGMTDKAEIAALNERMTRMSGAFSFLANAVAVAVSGLASDDQKTRDNTATQARELVAMAVSTLGNEDPYVKALDRIATITRSAE